MGPPVTGRQVQSVGISWPCRFSRATSVPRLMDALLAWYKIMPEILYTPKTRYSPLVVSKCNGFSSSSAGVRRIIGDGAEPLEFVVLSYSNVDPVDP